MTIIGDAKQATEVARQYLKPFAQFQLRSAKKMDVYWLVKVNIGLFEDKVLELEISETGEVLRAR